MDPKVYVVQTAPGAIERCVLMTTDPGDLVLDPTCGSGTTAYVAEQWGRRWITTDTSRVALALARRRVMAARFPCRVGGGAFARWPPSAAQTVRAVFPHTAFTKTHTSGMQARGSIARG